MPNLILSSDIDAFLSSANKAAARSELGLGSAAVASSDSFASLGSNTFTGLLSFSGATHAGIRMNNLTTAQKNALTPAAGMIVFDTDLSRFQSYSGSAWISHVRLTGDTMTGALGITAGSSAVSAPPLSVTQTWNGAGIQFIGPSINITDTASATTSSLFRVRGGAAGTTDKLSVTSNKTTISSADTLGGVLALAGYYGTVNFTIGGSSEITFNTITSFPSALGTRVIEYGNGANYIEFISQGTYQCMSASSNLLEVRRGTTAQKFGVSNTWTSTTSYERFKIDWATTSNTCRIGTSKGSGGGSTRALHFEVGDSAAIKISTAGAIDFAMLATTAETITPDKTFTVSIAGVAVKVPCF